MEEDPLEEYVLAQHKLSIIEILKDVDVKKHYSVNFNFVELFEIDTSLGNDILKEPEDALDALDQLIAHVQNILLETLDDTNLQPKPNIHARVYGLPASPELHRTIFPRSDDMDLFLQVTGTVVRVTAAKMLEYQRPYICTKCKHVEMIEADYNQKYILMPPKKCVNPEKCPGTNLISMGELNVENCKDYQEIKIQEQASKSGIGTMPSSMWVTLEDDLVDACKPGDDVTICGIVKRRCGPLIPGKRIDVELVMKANHIHVSNGQTSPSLITPEVREQFNSFWEKYKECPLEGRDLILKSFCPKLYGMYIVKLAMAMVLAGGSRCTQGNEMGIQIRSEPHILLVGDPGTGKSQLLRYAAKVIPRSVLTTGTGTTSAGLTVAAVMEDGQWQLEGGALVLADGGICCIDEFNSMKPHDRTSIHEAMEQQTISVAKASIVCKLRTRCSILAATNPKGGHLDSSQTLSLNLALPSPLLSRFDIVLMLKDCYDKEWDNLVADYILSGKGVNAIKIDASLWNLEMLQQYFIIIKSINPVLTPQANKILGSYYQAQRRAVTRNKARTTMRLLDSLVRLSQAHARLMFHKEVHVMDALFAIILIEASMYGECAILSLDAINVQAPFLAAPMESYAQLAKSILSKLGLHDILKKEFMFLSNGCKYNQEFSFCSEDIPSKNENSECSSANNEELFETTAEGSIEPKANRPSTSAVREFQVIESLEKQNNIQNIFEETNVSEDTNTNEIEAEQSHNKHKVFNETDWQLPKKPKLINKGAKEIQHEKVVELGRSDEDIANKSHGRKKRKNLKQHEQSKEPKSAKNTSTSSNLNDFQMLNLIPSVNDDFDLRILDYSGSSTSAFADMKMVGTENEVTAEEFDTFNKPENSVASAIETENKENSESTTHVKTKNEEKTVGSSDKPSQATNFKQFRKKFAFKPRNPPNEPDTENDVKPFNDINCDKMVNDEPDQSQTVYSLFSNQDEDFDAFDFEF